MKKIQPILLFKCPGSRKGIGGVIYEHCGANTDHERERLLSAGWSLTIEEAVDKAGSRAYAKTRPQPPKRVCVATGLPSVSHLILKERESISKEVIIDDEETKHEEINPISTEAGNEEESGEEDDLLDRFQKAPKELTKKEHIELGKALGLKLNMNFKEDTMINKITEVIEAI